MLNAPNWFWLQYFLDQTSFHFHAYIHIYPCSICPGDICPYQQYFSCCWPFCIHFLVPLLFGPQIFVPNFSFFWLDFFIQHFLYKNFFGLKLSWDQIFFNLSSLGLRFLEQYFCRHLFFYLNFVDQAANGAQKWPTGSWKRSIPRLLDPLIIFCSISFRFFCMEP